MNSGEIIQTITKVLQDNNITPQMMTEYIKQMNSDSEGYILLDTDGETNILEEMFEIYLEKK